MVKAVKRKSGREPGRVGKKERRIKLGSLLLIVLLVMGFSVATYWGFAARSEPEEAGLGGDGPEYGVGFLSGKEEGRVGSLTGNRAVFGQLEVPADLSARLGGNLYLLDNGLSQLIITNSSAKEIGDEARGNHIIYEVGECEGFDCLVRNLTNETMLFDVYELNESSGFLRTQRIGFPSQSGGAVL